VPGIYAASKRLVAGPLSAWRRARQLVQLEELVQLRVIEARLLERAVLLVRFGSMIGVLLVPRGAVLRQDLEEVHLRHGETSDVGDGARGG